MIIIKQRTIRPPTNFEIHRELDEIRDSYHSRKVMGNAKRRLTSPALKIGSASCTVSEISSGTLGWRFGRNSDVQFFKSKISGSGVRIKPLGVLDRDDLKALYADLDDAVVRSILEKILKRYSDFGMEAELARDAYLLSHICINKNMFSEARSMAELCLEICLKKNMKREADRASVILWKIGKQLGWNPRVYLQNLFCEYELDMPCREAKRISKII